MTDFAIDRVRDLTASARQNWRPVAIVAISIVLTALYLYGRPYIIYNDGDPHTYFSKAWYLMGRVGGTDVPSRGPGYPLWLILSGAATFDTWWGLAVSQITMAALAPLLFYGALAPASRNAGFGGALIFMLFGIPYEHMNWVMTEELFLFVELLSFVFMARYLCGVAWPPERPVSAGDRFSSFRARCRRWLATPYPIALLLSYDTMTKPAASPFFWIFILICLLWPMEPRQRYIGPIVLYVALMTAWGTYDYRYSPERFPQIGQPSSQAQRHFGDVYYGNGYATVDEDAPSIRPEDGAASARLYAAVAKAITEQRAAGQWNVVDPISAQQLYGRFASNDELLRNIFTRPNPMYFNLITGAAAYDGGDTLLNAVAAEHGNVGIEAYTKYIIHHPTVPLMGPPNPYVGFLFFTKFSRFFEFRHDNVHGAREAFAPSITGFTIPPDGPASKTFRDSIGFYIDAFPQFLNLGPDYLKDFGSEEDFRKYMIDSSGVAKYSGAMMGTLYGWFSILYGEEKTGQLAGRVGIEIALHDPAALGVLAGDYLEATALPGNGYFGAIGSHFRAFDWAHDFRGSFADIETSEASVLDTVVRMGHAAQLPARMAKKVGKVHERTSFAKATDATLAIQYGLSRWARPILFLSLLIFTGPLIITRIGGRFVTFLALAFFISAAAWDIGGMIEPSGDPRNEDVFFFFPLMIAALGFFSIPHFCRLARQSYPTASEPR